MHCAENNRISHRQLYRQFCMVFLAPFLLCLFGRDRLMNWNGLMGVVAATGLLCFSVIFLVRLAPYYQELEKTHHWLLRLCAGALFLGYVLLTAAYLLSVLTEVISLVVLEGISGRWISLITVLACSLGTERGMQRRGRLAEISAGILLGSVLLMMALSLGQARWEYFWEINTQQITGEAIIKSVYLYLSAFSGIGLLPFALGEVEKTAGTWKPILLAILTISAIMAGMLLLLPAVFGMGRLQSETYPILPLLSGTNLPQKVLARFDVLWMGFVLYGIFFSLGSLFHYGNQVLHVLYYPAKRQASNPTGALKERIPSLLLALAVWGLSILEIDGSMVQDYYVGFLGMVFLPLLILLQLWLLFSPRKKRRMVKTATVVGLLCLLMGLGGCAGIDPEKRLYPLALGVDKKQEFTVSYGIPVLPQATGQGGPQTLDDSSCLSLSGETFGQIEKKYQRSQEKYLDLGHLQVLILGAGILENRDWDLLLDYLKGESAVGENVYVFYGKDPEEILTWQSGSGTSVGEYLTGILENRVEKDAKPGVTLRQVYRQFYKDGELPKLPEVWLEQDQLYVS